MLPIDQPHQGLQGLDGLVSIPRLHNMFKKLYSNIPRKVTSPSRPVITLHRASMGTKGRADWDPSLYMRFGDERTRPARDLLAAIPLENPTQIIDLGCGPGNSTELLAARYPNSELSAMDSSPSMLQKARKTLPDVNFFQGDLRTYLPKQPVDLLYSNAVFQWLKKDERINVIKALLQSQPSGGIFAIQVPDNLQEPSHRHMIETANEEQFKGILDTTKLARDNFPPPSELYNIFKPLCTRVDIWHTQYQHRLESHDAIADWLKSTGLRPFLDPLDDTQKQAFLTSYIERLRTSYPVLVDGGVLLKFPRLFMVLYRA